MTIKNSFLIQLLCAVIFLFTTTGCTDIFIFNDLLFDDEEEIDPQIYIDQHFTKEQQDKANTAKDVTYLTTEEKTLIYFCNLARLDGKSFSDAFFNDFRESDNYHEKSLVETLDTIKDYPMLMPNEQLCKAAAYHVNDIGPKGLTGHQSSDGTSTLDRVSRYYKTSAMGENIAYGDGNAFHITYRFLLDKNVLPPGHRKNILKYKHARIGVSIGPHTEYTVCCVMDLSMDNDAQNTGK